MKKNIFFPCTCILYLLLVVVSCNENRKGNQQSVKNQQETMNNSANQPVKETGNNYSSENNRQSVKVIINGIVWDEKLEMDFQKVYNMKPIPGNYWYDAISGLWGNVGGQALGFIYPGHSYGALSGNVSNGNTGIFINSREIPMAEAMIWSQLMGVPAQQGRYWLDGRGNVGYEGNPYPVFNLYMLANQNNYKGKGGGDNFWSSRFARGNATDDNSFGYVSIPGSGITVTYGE